MESMSTFANTILRNKNYVHTNNGHTETWPEAARRVVTSVVKPYLPELVERLIKAVEQRKFMPGGRYLYASGRRYHQTNSCFLFRARDDKEGWGKLLNDCCVSLMTGGGIGVVYSDLRGEGELIHGMGGKSTGPCALACMVNENARYVRQGGSRRSAVWAGLHWWHPDVFRFVRLKEWPDWLIAKKREDFHIAAPMDGTNISVILDDEFFAAYHNPGHAKHKLAQEVFWACINSMMRTGEPGFSVDVGENGGENLRNACLTGDTLVAVADGRGAVPIKDLVGQSVRVYSATPGGHIVVGTMTNVHVSRHNAPVVKVTLEDGTSVRLTADHQVMLANGSFVEAGGLVVGSKLMPFSSRVNQKYRWVSCKRRGVKACWLALGRRSGEGDGCDVHHLNEDSLDDRPENLMLLEHGEHAKVNMFGERNPAVRVGYDEEWRIRQSIRSTGSGNGRFKDGKRVQPREMASRHGEILTGRKTWATTCQACGEEFAARSPRATTCSKRCAGVLSNRNRANYRSGRTVVSVQPDGCEDVYDGTVSSHHNFAIVTTPEPNTYDGTYAGMVVHNCTEVCSGDNNDMCNLGSINMGRVATLEEFADLVELGTAFLLCGTLYSKLPVAEMYTVREKNRRIGLGLMGLHEWLLKRSYQYGPCDELRAWMEVYVMSGAFAYRYADRLSISRPVATRSVAPTGTISIVAETTSGVEPIYALAYKRRYLDGNEYKAQYVIDAAGQRLVDAGVDPGLIEDSYSLAEDVGRRVGFQAWLQKYVDHGVASTVNLPSWGSSLNNDNSVTSFGNKLLGYLPQLRGITCYPDGSRGGQPLNRVSYQEAVKHVGKEFIEQAEVSNEQSCKNGVCGE